jgi:hypothetical protein
MTRLGGCTHLYLNTVHVSLQTTLSLRYTLSSMGDLKHRGAAAGCRFLHNMVEMASLIDPRGLVF